MLCIIKLQSFSLNYFYKNQSHSDTWLGRNTKAYLTKNKAMNVLLDTADALIEYFHLQGFFNACPTLSNNVSFLLIILILYPFLLHVFVLPNLRYYRFIIPESLLLVIYGCSQIFGASGTTRSRHKYAYKTSPKLPVE